MSPSSYSLTVGTLPSAVPGLLMLPNSSPPLIPLFLPPIWNRPAIPPPVAPVPLEFVPAVLLLSPPSPNFEKNPRFLTWFSFLSSRPTSSNPSSASAVAGWRSKGRDSIADRGNRGRRALSRDWRVLSDWIGERAEMSYDSVSILPLYWEFMDHIWPRLLCVSLTIVYLESYHVNGIDRTYKRPPVRIKWFTRYGKVLYVLTRFCRTRDIGPARP